jgi:phage repressor protein C with HTH and peptisase S24 domain
MRKSNLFGKKKVKHQDLSLNALPIIMMESELLRSKPPAGSGFYNEDYIENYRLIMTTEIPEHDFTLDVEGNSMFPAIMDGDVVFVWCK